MPTQDQEVNESITLYGDSKYTTSLLEKSTSFIFETVNEIQVNLLERMEDDVAKNEAMERCENILHMSLGQLENGVFKRVQKVNYNTLSNSASVKAMQNKCNHHRQKNAYEVNDVQLKAMESSCNSLINNGSLQKSSLTP